MIDLMKTFGEQFGLVPLYAVIIGFGGFMATSIKHLIMMMGIFCGLYITMFKSFNLKAQFGPLDVTQYLPVSQDTGNMVVAAVFVYAVGFAAYGLRMALFTRRTA